jgi:ABC-type Fe3+-hydroxamate transport system substrate-binding protein
MATRDKSSKFIELANKRVNRAIKDLQLVANLANRQNYEFTDDQAKKIVKALQQELDAVRQSFQATTDPSRNAFKL